ncbi:PREDICTED: NCK-interacting protein with SH3 domain-like [Branchiostoma belcheri]|uniref:NCK-interacting protein with SH3 domain-like n=1 Tax=Branchiostoma belcheri TaxID=7741 RepID=A0A6P4XP45_BRABE|nr:PREDICTED: NCK-interacting protein with SH3 domain-like [Branchiostoma belcheri]
MYRALYDFKADDATALSFRVGQRFTLLDRSDAHWWEVTDDAGRVGYVPYNYMEKDESAESGDIIRSIDRGIEQVHMAAMNNGGTYTAQHREVLQKLIAHRKATIDKQSQDYVHQQSVGIPSQPGRPAPKAPVSRVPDSPTRRRSTKSHRAPPAPNQVTVPPQRTVSSEACMQAPDTSSIQRPAHMQKFEIYQDTSAKVATADTSSQTERYPLKDKSSQETYNIPENMGSELVELVRVNTDVSFQKSRTAVSSILNHIKDKVPGLERAMEDIMRQVNSSKLHTVKSGDGSQDSERLEVIFSEMSSVKDDSQQRSWHLYEDQSIILEYLEELMSILENAMPAVCRKAVQKNNYEVLHNMVQYYQMEHRLPIRLALLQVFAGLCGLEREVISCLVCSILPMELARDMQDSVEALQKLQYSALLLTMLFSTGEAIPVHHYEHLSEEFVSFLLSHVEEPPEGDIHEQVPDLFLNLILAFNLHFSDPKDNLVMKAIASSSNVRTFSEKIMLLVNRGDDPVHMFDHEPRPPNSLLKFLADVFSSEVTSGIFYTTDMMVLIDIIVRQVSDLPPGDEIRTEHLSLFHSIMKNTSYCEHRHRRDDLQQCFLAIQREEEKEGEADKFIVGQIWADFPDIFTRSDLV